MNNDELKAFIKELITQEFSAIKTALLTSESREIWRMQDIANYLHYSYEHVMRLINKAPDFPAEVEYRRWFAGDVIAYFEKRRKQRGR